jgi:hypothetical protein
LLGFDESSRLTWVGEELSWPKAELLLSENNVKERSASLPAALSFLLMFLFFIVSP